MKVKILAGAIAALMYGTAALAADGDCPPSSRASADPGGQRTLLAQAQDEQLPVDDNLQEDDSVIIETEPVPDATGATQDSLQDEGVGGAGEAGQEDSSMQQPGIGGSGEPLTGARGEVILRCEPIQQRPGTGGAGAEGWEAPAPDLSQQQPPRSEVYPEQPQEEAYPVQPEEEAIGGGGITQPPPADFTPSAERAEPIEPLEVERRDEADTRGLTLLVGGGVEGYTGALAPQLNPGPTAGVRAALRPTQVLGIELGYSGALNNIDVVGSEGDATDGPDLIRNGGNAVVTLALLPSAWQPYLLGGIGIDDYNFRGGQALGYEDDTVGSVPAGVGFRGHVGDFTVDARANYNFLFDKEFAPGVESGGGDFEEGGSYQGTLSVGGTF